MPASFFRSCHRFKDYPQFYSYWQDVLNVDLRTRGQNYKFKIAFGWLTPPWLTIQKFCYKIFIDRSFSYERIEKHTKRWKTCNLSCLISEGPKLGTSFCVFPDLHRVGSLVSPCPLSHWNTHKFWSKIPNEDKQRIETPLATDLNQ